MIQIRRGQNGGREERRQPAAATVPEWDRDVTGLSTSCSDETAVTLQRWWKTASLHTEAHQRQLSAPLCQILPGKRYW